MWYRTEVSADQLFECETSHLSIDRNTNLEMIANQCAEDFFNNHDGWEAPWPLEIYLHESEDGPEVAKLFVEMEAEPVFYSKVIK